MNKFKKTVAVLFYLLSIHLLSILFFTIFRLLLYVVNMNMAGEDNGLPFLWKALLHGWQFDNLIASYITALPLLVLSILTLFNKIPKAAISAFNIFFVVVYTLCFIICIADIPYFAYFSSHINFAAFGWFEFGGETAGLFFQEKSYYPYFVLLIVSVVIFAWTVRRFGKKLLKANTENLQKRDYKFYIPLVVLSWGICFAGMRGSFQLYSLQIDYAYFSNNSFFNQLGVNPDFFLMKSISFEQTNNVNDQMTAEDAIAMVQKELNITQPQNDFPLQREIIPDTCAHQKQPNIVILLLESMSTKYLEYESNGKPLTPYLHHLISKSYYFENFYSAGIHTNNGIVSTLYGFPALFNKSSTKSVLLTLARYDGLPLNLKNNGYQTFFFVGGNAAFDHMNVFLYENGFDRVFSQNDYPKEKVTNIFGVQDDYLLEFSLEQLNKMTENNKPVLATVLTVSNHKPYDVPKQYKDRADTKDKQIVCFVDDAIRAFMEKAEKQAWYENTIFVILGDHGKILEGNKYDMMLSYNHIPLILFSPMFKDAPRKFSQFGGQIDIFPTVMGLLNLPYTNNSLGIDLMRESRPCMYFVNDNQLGCINNDFLYVRNVLAKKDILYDLHSPTTDNIMEQQPQAYKLLKDYSVSMMVTADYMLKNNFGIVAKK